ncbi:hypothetical protein LJK88_20645 [Paenibacillus sp. P26]|nr:hypothetical protein LJK88_20645 [Paenibacillus sp. P26]UUZ95956.1 hypothetical protein LJK87_17220 [Paenibacillus sp. P25]
MLDKLKKPGFILGMPGAAKIVPDNFGIAIPDEAVNQIAGGIGAMLVVIGIFMDHGKSES